MYKAYTKDSLSYLDNLLISAHAVFKCLRRGLGRQIHLNLVGYLDGDRFSWLALLENFFSVSVSVSPWPQTTRNGQRADIR